MEILPTLDLFNFTEPIATESQYILTSPRSLEACARFGIKPVELLPKTNTEFEEDYGSFTENPAVLYKKFEKERLRKLRLCRQERERIIDENAHEESGEESICDEIFSSGDYDNYCMMNSPRDNCNWREKDETQKAKTIEKPSILDYLDATSKYPSSIINNVDQEESRDQYHEDNTPASSNKTGGNLSDPGTFPIQNGQTGTPVKKKKQPNLKRSQSLRVKRDVEQSKTSPIIVPLTDEDSYKKSDEDNVDISCASHNSTYSVLSDTSTFGIPNGTSEKKKKPNSLKRSKSLRVKRDTEYNRCSVVSAPIIHETSYKENNGDNREERTSASQHTAYNGLSDSTRFAVHEAASQKKEKPNKVKRSQSFKMKREKSQDDVGDIAMTLPKTMKENLSLMSKKDKRLLDTYLLKLTSEQQYSDTSSGCKDCWNPNLKTLNKTKRKISCSALERKMEREENMSQIQSNNEKVETELQASKWKTRYKKQVQKMDQKLNLIEKDRYFGNEIYSNDNNSNKWQKRKTPKSLLPFSTSIFHEEQKNEKLLRAERVAQLNELQEKHKRAGEVFQERMKQKLQRREFNKLKQLERKEFQERQLNVMEKDLMLWQRELRNYQDICVARASKIVQKRNAIISAKTHEKRHQKEVGHAILKSKVDEEERLRQEELKTLVNIKDTRSKMIINAKEEYANAGRECAQMSRSIRYRIQDKNIQSSFDKMASKGERMARLEKMSSANKSEQNSSFGIKQRKNQSILTLG